MAETTPVVLRMPPDLYEQIKARAAECDLSASQWMRAALRIALAGPRRELVISRSMDRGGIEFREPVLSEPLASEVKAAMKPCKVHPPVESSVGTAWPVGRRYDARHVFLAIRG